MKKTPFALLSALIIGTLFAAPAGASEADQAADETDQEEAPEEIGPQASGRIQLYTDANYGGNSEGGNVVGCINVLHNDRHSSVRITTGRFRLYQDGNCVGTYHTTSTSIANLHSIGWGDRITSYKPI